jgi:peptidoglycan/xylan/chitin deacetylase (PgdA/CDA1 family)
MDEDLFEQQLVWIKKHFNSMGLAQALELQKKHKLPERSVAITVDDGYEDSFTTILPLLKKHELTATFFISTSGIERGYLWDELVSSSIFMLDSCVSELTVLGKSYDLSTYNKRKNCVTAITDKIKYSELVKRDSLITQLLSEVTPQSLPHQFLTEEQIKKLYDEGMGIGSHTINHPILCAEEAIVAKKEIQEPKTILEKIIGNSVDFLAYPNGKKYIDFNEQHEKIAKTCGYKGAFSSDWGCIAKNNNNFSYKRFTPWDKTEIRFCLRLALNFNKLYNRLMIK